MTNLQTFRATAKASLASKSTHAGREYLVVPVIALVEGVIHASNAKSPEYVSPDVYSIAPQGWDGRPVFHGHPAVDGEYVSGNLPEVLETAAGKVFNAEYKDEKLKMEAWVALEQPTPDGIDLVERLERGDDVEVSVGVFVEVVEESGTFRGMKYDRKWQRITPDHLALLRSDEVGACSRDMGCGVRAAKGAPMKRVDKQNASLFARIMEAFRIQQSPEEMSDADVRRKLFDACRAADPRCGYVEAVYASKDLFVYCVYPESYSAAMQYYQRSFTVSADGVITVGDEATEVEPVLRYEPVGASEEPVAATAGAGTCGCQKNNPPKHQEQKMACKDKVAAFIAKVSGRGFAQADAAFLEGLTDEQFQKIEELGEPVTVEKTVEVPKEVVKEVQVQVGAPKTVAEAKAMLPEGERAAFEAFEVAQATKKAATIKVLKDSGRCTIADEVLSAKTQDELDQLVQLSGQAVDYAGAGAPRGTDQGEGIDAPRNLSEAIAASRKR